MIYYIPSGTWCGFDSNVTKEKDIELHIIYNCKRISNQLNYLNQLGELELLN